jgi:THO complex subunit 3
MTALPSYPQHVQTNQMAFSHSTSASSQTLLLTTGSGRVTIHSYTPQTGPSMPPLQALNAHPSACISLALSPRADLLAVGGSDAIISLWDTRDWICRHALGKMTGPVRTVGFSWDGSFVCGGSDEGSGIEVAHAVSGEYVCRIETSHPAPVVEWHPNRYWIAYAGDPGGLRIVGMAGGV